MLFPREFSQGESSLSVQNARTPAEVRVSKDSATELYAFINEVDGEDVKALANMSRAFSLQSWVISMDRFAGLEAEFGLRLDSQLFLVKAGESDESSVGIYEAYAVHGQVRKSLEREMSQEGFLASSSRYDH